MEFTRPLTSAHLLLRFQTASLVIGEDETRVVFPAIDFEQRDKPPIENLNMDRDGPHVVRVDVCRIGNNEGRSGHFGHSGVERVSLFLPPEPFSQLVKSVEELRDEPTIDVEAEVDANGNVVGLTIKGQPVKMVLKSYITPSKRSKRRAGIP